MGWKVISAMRYSNQHPDARKRGKVFTMESQATYNTRKEAQQQATGSAKYDRLIGREGVVYSVRQVRDPNPIRRKRRSPWPKGKTPPHLRKYLFK